MKTSINNRSFIVEYNYHPAVHHYREIGIEESACVDVTEIKYYSKHFGRSFVIENPPERMLEKIVDQSLEAHEEKKYDRAEFEQEERKLEYYCEINRRDN